MDKKIKLTKTVIDKLECEEGSRETVYHDTAIPGLQLRVWSSGRKVFVVRRKLGGKAKRVTLGDYPSMTIEQARKAAACTLGDISSGIDPNAKKRAEEAREVTLRHCFEAYRKSRTSLKPSTADDYLQSLEQYCSDWLDKPMLNINRDKVERRHKEIGQKSPTRANKVMRIVRALFEYAHGKYEDEDGNPIILHNPVKRLSHAKAWYKESRRSTFIKSGDLKPWYEAVTTAPEWMGGYDTEGLRDYLLLVLFTGLRRREAASLRWTDVDMRHGTLTISVTKNGHPHTLPLSSFLSELFQRRKAMTKDSEFVFPARGETGHLQEPKKAVAKVRDKSGVYFTLHDLRRTFITVAESLGIRDYTLKRLLNHRSSGDVTDGYIVTDVERLREPMQQITDRLLLLASKPDNVVTFNTQQA